MHDLDQSHVQKNNYYLSGRCTACPNNRLFSPQRDAYHYPVQKTTIISQEDAHPVQIINYFSPERCTACSTTCWPPCALPTCSSSAATSPSPQSPLASPKFSTLVNPQKYMKIQVQVLKIEQPCLCSQKYHFSDFANSQFSTWSNFKRGLRDAED